LKKNASLLVVLFITTLALIGSLSVIGVLQSAKRISSSGIIIQSLPLVIPPIPPPNPPPLPPPEPQLAIDVYSDPSCTQILSTIEWGTLEAGGSIEKIIYIRNSGDDGVYLQLTTANWDPVNAEGPIQLFWNYNGDNISPGNIIQVKLTLTISASISGIDNFNFDVVIIGSVI